MKQTNLFQKEWKAVCYKRQQLLSSNSWWYSSGMGYWYSCIKNYMIMLQFIRKPYRAGLKSHPHIMQVLMKAKLLMSSSKVKRL